MNKSQTRFLYSTFIFILVFRSFEDPFPNMSACTNKDKLIRTWHARNVTKLIQSRIEAGKLNSISSRSSRSQSSSSGLISGNVRIPAWSCLSFTEFLRIFYRAVYTGEHLPSFHPGSWNVSCVHVFRSCPPFSLPSSPNCTASLELSFFNRNANIAE